MLMQRSRRASGFTMIEMAVTMSIFAILVALGVPAMTTWIRNNKVRTVADSLQTGLRLAQAESLRRSRQVVFALTNSTTPSTAIPLPAVANGNSWAIWTMPSMTNAADETPQFIQSGVLSNASANVTINGVAAVCFNSLGRLVNNATSVTAITGAANNCVQPTTPPPQQPTAPPAEVFSVSTPGADRPLQVNLSLGGQIHMCVLNVALSATHPEGC
jgi:type IV fimbrial biogenesis protein FimT